jgi:hypothetical protein
MDRFKMLGDTVREFAAEALPFAQLALHAVAPHIGVAVAIGRRAVKLCEVLNADDGRAVLEVPLPVDIGLPVDLSIETELDDDLDTVGRPFAFHASLPDGLSGALDIEVRPGEPEEPRPQSHSDDDGEEEQPGEPGVDRPAGARASDAGSPRPALLRGEDSSQAGPVEVQRLAFPSSAEEGKDRPHPGGEAETQPGAIVAHTDQPGFEEDQVSDLAARISGALGTIPPLRKGQGQRELSKSFAPFALSTASQAQDKEIQQVTIAEQMSLEADGSNPELSTGPGQQPEVDAGTGRISADTSSTWSVISGLNIVAITCDLTKRLEEAGSARRGIVAASVVQALRPLLDSQFACDENPDESEGSLSVSLPYSQKSLFPTPENTDVENSHQAPRQTDAVDLIVIYDSCNRIIILVFGRRKSKLATSTCLRISLGTNSTISIREASCTRQSRHAASRMSLAWLPGLADERQVSVVTQRTP